MTMTRIETRPILAVGLAAAILVYVGCTRKDSPSTPGTSSKAASSQVSTGTETPSASSGKLFADWKGLAAALAVSGEMNGYLDPCGCTEGQLGGLGRRYDLFERMANQKIPFVKIDLGTLTKNPAGERGGLDQAKVKFDTALKALESMKYDALALGPEDLKLGIDHTLSVYLNHKDQIKVVSANAAFDPALAAAFEGTIRESVVAQAGAFKIGITAVLDPAEYNALKDPQRDTLQVKPPAEVLPTLLAKLEAESDLQVLMVQGPPEMAKALAEAYPGFDIVVSRSEYADPDGNPVMVNNGATQIVTVGMKGKYVGIIGLFPPETGKTPTTKYQRQSLNAARLHNAEPMRVLIDEEMQSQLKALGIVENIVRHANVEAPAGSTYVGAVGCKSCHPNTFARWEGTGHAKAYEPLVHNPKDPKRKREFDAECISCHTTGFTYNSGWVSAEKTPYLKGNQCENCHGPASKHVAEPKNPEFLKAMSRTAESADKGGLCHKCHDEDNSPHFNFASYYGKIAHKGMDDYKDPRVLKGMTPEQARAAK
jgi:hypothetical protein